MNSKFFIIFMISAMAFIPFFWWCTSDYREKKRGRKRLWEFNIPCRKCRYGNICGRQKSFRKDYYRILKARKEGLTKISIQCSYFTGGKNDEETKTT